MPILRLVAEGVGPFERIDVDFSDGNGKPHLGPHIVVGTNGTGKSTLLRTIAWMFADREHYGFDFGLWSYALKGHAKSRAAVSLKTVQGSTVKATGYMEDDDLPLWADRQMGSLLARGFMHGPPVDRFVSLTETHRSGHPILCATYRPTPNLRVVREPDLSARLQDSMEGALAFDSTVDSARVQGWLLRLYSARAIAKQKQQLQPPDSIPVLERAVSLMLGGEFQMDVELPRFEVLLQTPMGTCNVFQLPDGLRSTLGWCADFLMRREERVAQDWLGAQRPSILLIDEIDSHLHPQWQRRILPGLRRALPDVQIIVTTHSPFVASSCPGAKLHICEREGSQPATIRSETSPFGQKLLTTISGVFGIDSRFDVVTERDLNEWYGLKRRQSALSSEEQDRLSQLTQELANRSEELQAIVAGPDQISPQSVTSLLEATSKKRRKVKS